ncbi:acetylornithine/N-succinyldiaminopimelate aminotransferase [Ruminococcus sp. YE71]|uniref:aspartate aminotransferase family protein n=1 Tax=unclassified Ruminococcus TaxID=2608920 RepID=UPI00088F4877|nr:MULTISPECIES: aspartate aminotransferase family protein [unclassified Ruminococcus]SDA30596.1 acetylornithine/N-succinyldiaminopimelate aminotransferase [Ruminococcus sp. YE78]SFW50139.1 acetylornithine/N-succinyldiaminopimelate aminotransferase [Ruminococcus sp. YE71]
MNTIEQFNEHVMGSYGRYDLVLEKGEGRTAVAEDGKEYIDFGSGIGTNSLGYCNELWVKAVCDQAHSIQHTSNYYYTKVQADFAKRLCEAAGYSKMFFGNSGAEANECAIKIARKYSFDKYGKDAERNIIVTLKNSFHGRTMGTLSATGQDVFHNYFFPFLPGFVNAEANDIDDLKKVLAENKGKVCAVMFELIQGEGGVVSLTKEFVNAIFEECAKDDILTVCDEVQTGVGRTGSLLTSEQYGVKPDITTLAKGLAGGVPIGVCLAGEKCANVLTPGTHGSTFGGNPIACAGGNAVLETVLSDGFLDSVVQKGYYFWQKLGEMDAVDHVDGMGLMIGVQLKSGDAHDIAKKCLDNGLLILTAKDKLRFLPPLNISYEEIDKGLAILAEILK